MLAGVFSGLGWQHGERGDCLADRLRPGRLGHAVMRRLQLAGQRFGRLVALRDVGSACQQRLWHCRCDCGDEVTVMARSLRSGNTKSCGCWNRERASAAMSRRNITHGGAHHAHRHPLYQTWLSMRQRCTNPNVNNYHRYGGRGITVCTRWQDFAAFLSDVGERPSPQHSLDRIQNDGNYEPGNVRWATRVEQARNSRMTPLRRAASRANMALVNAERLSRRQRGR